MSWDNKGKSQKKWLYGGGLILTLVIALSFYAMQDYSVYFYTPAELAEKASTLEGSEIRVGGMVKPNSVVWNPKTLGLNFVMWDMKGVEIPVSYKGAPPDMFKEGSGVVVEGSLGSSGEINLLARNLFVKHSEEYRIPEEAHKIDPRLVENSILKDEKL